MAERVKIGQILLERGLIIQSLLEGALEKQSLETLKGRKIGEILLEDGIISEEALFESLAIQWKLEFSAIIPHDNLDQKVLERFPLEHLRKHRFFPCKKESGKITVYTSEPQNHSVLNEVYMLFKLPLRVILTPPSTIISALNELYGRGRGSTEIIEDLTIESGLNEELENLQIEDVLASANKAPVIKFVNTMIFQALRERASDIHLEPSPDKFRIRYRIDGILFERFSPPRNLNAPIASRIKIMAGLDIAERRLPQDGKVRVRFGEREVDIRVSSIPSVYGERVVLRLLDRKSELLTLEMMGMQEDTLVVFDALIRRPNGILLVTGPTGSGKTTTLYGAIMRIMSPDSNIITLEDPVEYELKGANQIPVKPKIGLTFAAGLRSILRQDPDIIMVGEIRDEETAAMAIQAGLTGHMVFSTLHTNDSVSAGIRLIDMKVEPYLVASTLIGALAQRLVRRLCLKCRKKLPDSTYIQTGCEECSKTGFKGRVGLFELLSVDDEIASMISSRTPLDLIRNKAEKKGMRSLLQDGIQKIKSGLTTQDEVERSVKA
ncbi:MAG: Flp pilus assembly complex ATPase component TadA [Candidatus Riflebacteria bacterium]|nr:Flp pilus assembly complex ATPase component TadA [Candidatus Riflebacteria bacterium]